MTSTLWFLHNFYYQITSSLLFCLSSNYSNKNQDFASTTYSPLIMYLIHLRCLLEYLLLTLMMWKAIIYFFPFQRHMKGQNRKKHARTNNETIMRLQRQQNSKLIEDHYNYIYFTCFFGKSVILLHWSKFLHRYV